MRCIWDKARLVLSGGHPLRQFTDEMADEHVGFLDAGHGRGRDTDGDIGDVCQWTSLSQEGDRSRAELPGRAYGL